MVFCRMTYLRDLSFEEQVCIQADHPGQLTGYIAYISCPSHCLVVSVGCTSSLSEKINTIFCYGIFDISDFSSLFKSVILYNLSLYWYFGDDGVWLGVYLSLIRIYNAKVDSSQRLTYKYNITEGFRHIVNPKIIYKGQTL